MVIVRISGGLGNQMFQYAAGMACAARNNCSLKVDLRSYRKPPRDQEDSRKFELGIFNNSIDEATADELNYINEFNVNKLYKIYNRTKKKLHLKPAYTYCWEKVPMHFDPTVLSSIGSLIYIDGDWQNEKYFKYIDKYIRKIFTFSDEYIDEKSQVLRDDIALSNSVSFHVRRGDYLNNDVHKPCSLDYYERAIDIIKSKVNNPKFYVFSDDVDWVRNNIDFKNITTVFIDHNTGKNSYMDMYLMSQCKYNVIANSSFSWWGAWLNRNPGKIVIAPDEWLSFLSVKAADVVPDTWLIS